ncbi:hypothetical protein GCM10007916_25030 [Psychromonas marina]|uniref:Uncharacterized protein n=1 Tax=Psychromonas marina TaxID=88364 RepID=A0ABQ6E2G5_9GAMM|nr:hypothetical protein [Psychromonas marina]GLS91434.1 hypothetical protein GCM10007916_25030 [Psychromonas marina]
MSSNILAVSYQDLCAKGLINDLKLAATCDIKCVCRLSCNRCPKVFSSIDIQKVRIKGIQLDYVAFIKTQADDDDIELHLNADNLQALLKENNIAYRTILT